MKRLAIFASGTGTNAERLIEYFRTKDSARVELVLTNRADAGVIERAGRLDVKTVIFSREELYDSKHVAELLIEEKIDFIILAGFLWLVPDSLLMEYQGKIVNIHPALLPLYGGKGMYGDRVHRAVIENGEKESGITIHQVNQAYDEGDIIFQATCPVKENDTPALLAKRIHELEYKHFPRVVEEVLKEL